MGRVHFLRTHGLTVSLQCYVQSEISLENVVLVAKRSQYCIVCGIQPNKDFVFLGGGSTFTPLGQKPQAEPIRIRTLVLICIQLNTLVFNYIYIYIFISNIPIFIYIYIYYFIGIQFWNLYIYIYWNIGSGFFSMFRNLIIPILEGSNNIR